MKIQKKKMGRGVGGEGGGGVRVDVNKQRIEVFVKIQNWGGGDWVGGSGLGGQGGCE